MKKPTIISLFAGCGGSSLGYKWAGYKELMAIDYNDNSVETFKLNFPNIPIEKWDLTRTTGKNIMDYCNIKKEELDLLDGSPPCQGFSTAGKRQVTDSRNDLILHFIRLVNEIQPKVFVMENVSGMVKGRMKGLFKEYMKEMKKLNYKVRCKLLNAKYYNVPQSRERLFWIGIRKDLNKEPIFPEPKKELISIGSILKNIKPKKARKLTEKELFYWKKMKIGERGSDYHPKGNWFGFIKVNPYKPAPTVIKLAGNGLCHWKEARHFDSEELKLFCSFPKEFKFISSEQERRDRIGNAVMPKQMEAIAKTLKENIFTKLYI